jgi:hypothetical protein
MVFEVASRVLTRLERCLRREGYLDSVEPEESEALDRRPFDLIEIRRGRGRARARNFLRTVNRATNWEGERIDGGAERASNEA